MQRTRLDEHLIVAFALICLIAFAGRAYAADAGNPAPAPTMNLVPNADVDLQFPQLPDTFYTMKTGKKVVPQLAARLPSNYSTSGKFPLFVFLAGGDGGDAGKDAPGGPRNTIGATDYIAVNLPLFKKAIDPNAKAGDVLPADAQAGLPAPILAQIKAMSASGFVTQGDYDVISSSYATMLGKLYETIPNIDPDRSILAGFSNGAHTIGVLLAGHDPYVLGHFHSFCLVEGGMGMALVPQKTLTPELKNHRILIMMGDGAGQTGWGSAERPFMTQMMKNFTDQAKAMGIDCSFVTMQNTAHSFSPAYYPVLRQWAAGGSAETAAGANTAAAPAAAPAPVATPAPGAAANK